MLIPSCYLSNSMPNNVKKNVLSYVQKTRDDQVRSPAADQSELCLTLTRLVQRIVDRLKKMDMLYEVPKGADDDWYWIFATVNEGRSRHANVITNDLMRDHKLAFMEPRPFLRWRNAHVSLYDLVDNSPRVQIRDPGKAPLPPSIPYIMVWTNHSSVCSHFRPRDTIQRQRARAHPIRGGRLVAVCELQGAYIRYKIM